MSTIGVLEPVLKVIAFILKAFAIFFFVRGLLYLIGIRYNIPLVDDLFWWIIGLILGLGDSGGELFFFWKRYF